MKDNSGFAWILLEWACVVTLVAIAIYHLNPLLRLPKHPNNQPIELNQ